MSDDDIECIGVCQTDDFGYCIGCGRRLAEAVVPVPTTPPPAEAPNPALPASPGPADPAQAN